jgi:hypothetical protein
MIRDGYTGFRPGSRGQKGTGSRIRNTTGSSGYFELDYFELACTYIRGHNTTIFICSDEQDDKFLKLI